MGKVINILTPYSYSSKFSKINDAALKKHCKLKPPFQVREPRNLHNEVESDLCPGGPLLWLLRRQELVMQGSMHSIYRVYSVSGHQMCNQNNQV